GGEAAEAVVALDQRHVRAGLRRRPGRRAARRPATDHDDVAAMVDVDLARLLADRPAALRRRQVAARTLEHVRAEEALLAVPGDPLHLDFVGHRALSDFDSSLIVMPEPGKRGLERLGCAHPGLSLVARLPARWRSGYAPDCKSVYAGS